MSGRGKKINQVKNERAHADWMAGKVIGRRKQVWHWDFVELHDDGLRIKGGRGHWERV